jgi:hypothetical protein
MRLPGCRPSRRLALATSATLASSAAASTISGALAKPLKVIHRPIDSSQMKIRRAHPVPGGPGSVTPDVADDARGEQQGSDEADHRDRPRNEARRYDQPSRKALRAGTPVPRTKVSCGR